MKTKDEYIEFNKRFYYYLDWLIRESKSNNSSWAYDILKECEQKSVDFNGVILKKLIDDYEETVINSKRVQLLPMGFINNSIPRSFISKEDMPLNCRVTGNTFRHMFLTKEDFVPFYYPNDSRKPLKESFQRLCSAYTKHYQASLDEKWTPEDFYNMLFELKYLSVKYAQDEETHEIYAVGFFGAAVRNGAGGQSLTNAELFVMPEFRNMGIARKLVAFTFEQAQKDGIENFDSITYRTQGSDALAFWEKIGASVSGLIHIEGSVLEILRKIEQPTVLKKIPSKSNMKS